jgi:hypothetical protein
METRRCRNGRPRAKGRASPHADAEREYAYDRESKVGKPDRALVESAANGLVVVDLQCDWKVVFPSGK